MSSPGAVGPLVWAVDCRPTSRLTSMVEDWPVVDTVDLDPW